MRRAGWLLLLWCALGMAADDAVTRGAAVYRFGPVFPEAPADWPIARVSAFKSKFGARSVPTIVGSLFLNPAAAEAAVQRAAAIMPTLARRSRVAKPGHSHAADIVAHGMRIIGVDASVESDAAGVLVTDAGVEGGWQAARIAAAGGRPAVVLRPERAHRYLDGLSFVALDCEVPRLARALAAGERPWQRLRTFHVTHAIESDRGVPIVADGAGHALWCWLPLDRSGVLLIGTELARDLTRIRQGDPAAAANRPTEAQWGFVGERPNYLFEGQLEPHRPHERYADWWLWTLRNALERHAGVVPKAVLPFGAPGAVVVTGDDDQAALADYRGQAEKLGPLPVTYFLHPLTKHDRASLTAHAKGRAIEWELHPDALEMPQSYAARLAEQTRWFEALTGRRARLVRNHGFLNDGYWGHAPAWLAEGIIGSSNLPGLDARMLNGSLLPARLALGGQLTAHWSVLTAFGDGVFFICEWDGARAQAAVMAEGRRILDSGVPGILVFNLHPANHEKADGMHRAVRALIDELGFAAMTLGDAIKWFQARDEGVHLDELDSMVPPRSFSSLSRNAFARAALALARHLLGARRRERFGDA